MRRPFQLADARLKRSAQFAVIFDQQVQANDLLGLIIPGAIRLAITGQAQVGVSGLARVQYWLHPQDAPLPKDDPHFTTAPWQDARILPLPANWAGEMDISRLHPAQFDPATRQPREWPMRYTLCSWAALLREVKPGKYDLRCRTVDLAGHGQPMPRPFAKAGRNAIQKVALVVEG